MSSLLDLMEITSTDAGSYEMKKNYLIYRVRQKK